MEAVEDVWATKSMNLLWEYAGILVHRTKSIRKLLEHACARLTISELEELAENVEPMKYILQTNKFVSVLKDSI